MLVGGHRMLALSTVSPRDMLPETVNTECPYCIIDPAAEQSMESPPLALFPTVNCMSLGQLQWVEAPVEPGMGLGARGTKLDAT